MEYNKVQQGSSYILTTTEEYVGARIDTFVSDQFQQYSRSFLKKLFDKKQILLNTSKKAKPGYFLKLGDKVAVSFPEYDLAIPQKDIPDIIGVNIIAKEKDFLIIEKPAGLTVHPPDKTCQEVTLSDWIAKTYDDIAHVGIVDRPGIVHRLDKNTSGIMIIPRTSQAHATFSDMFKSREIKKTYFALVHGHPPEEGTIDYFIGRHPSVRNKMHHFNELTKQSTSRESVSHYKVITYYKEHSLVEVKPETGRTHQIRVHLAAIGFPILADHLYGTKSKLTQRHALHAHQLEFEYNNKNYLFTSPIDPELQEIINNLEEIEVADYSENN